MFIPFDSSRISTLKCSSVALHHPNRLIDLQRSVVYRVS